MIDGRVPFVLQLRLENDTVTLLFRQVDGAVSEAKTKVPFLIKWKCDDKVVGVKIANASQRVFGVD